MNFAGCEGGYSLGPALAESLRVASALVGYHLVGSVRAEHEKIPIAITADVIDGLAACVATIQMSEKFQFLIQIKPLIQVPHQLVKVAVHCGPPGVELANPFLRLVSRAVGA